MEQVTTDLIDVDDPAEFVLRIDERGQCKRRREWFGSAGGYVRQAKDSGAIEKTVQTYGKALSFWSGELPFHYMDALQRSARELVSSAKAMGTATGYITFGPLDVFNQQWPPNVWVLLWHPALGPIRQAIASEDEGYGVEFARPTAYALQTIARMLIEARKQRAMELPTYVAAIPGDGGLRIYFDHDVRHLSVAIPSSGVGKGYIYHEYGDDYGVDEDLSAKGILRWLDWLADT